MIERRDNGPIFKFHNLILSIACHLLLDIIQYHPVCALSFFPISQLLNFIPDLWFQQIFNLKIKYMGFPYVDLLLKFSTLNKKKALATIIHSLSIFQWFIAKTISIVVFPIFIVSFISKIKETHKNLMFELLVNP